MSLLLARRPGFTFHHDFAKGAVISNLNNLTTDSGHSCANSFGTGVSATPKTVQKSDGTVGYTCQGTVNGLYSHLVADVGGPICYIRVLARFDLSGSTDNELLAFIAWSFTNFASFSDPRSGNHVLNFQDRSQPQTYDSTTTPVTTSPWGTGGDNYGNLGTGWRVYEMFVSQAENAVVLRMPNGKVRSYTAALVGSLNSRYIDIEIGAGSSADTDGDILVASVDAETPALASADAMAYINRGLALAGYGPIVLTAPPTTPVLISQSDLDSAASDLSPGTASKTAHPGATGSNRLAIVTVQVSPTVLSGALTGHVPAVTYGGVAMTSVGKVAVNAEVDNPMYFVEKFVLLDCPSGAQDVAVTYTKSGETYRLTGVVETWENVSAVGSAVVQFGTGSPATQTLTVTGSAGDVAHMTFICESSGSYSGQTGTVVRNQAQGTQRCPFLVEYKALAGTSASDTVTRALGTSDWAHIGLVLEAA